MFNYITLRHYPKNIRINHILFNYNSICNRCNTQKASDETINNEKIDSEAGELFGESIDENNLDTKSKIHGNAATIKTSIETEEFIS